jgi:hypothetical protein
MLISRSLLQPHAEPERMASRMLSGFFPMYSIINVVLASTPQVPDTGSSGLLLGLGILSLGIVARLVKNRKR